MVSFEPDESPDLVEDGCREEESSVIEAQTVEILELVEEGEGQLGHMNAMGLIEHESAAKGDGRLRELLFFSDGMGGVGNQVVHQIEKDPFFDADSRHEDL